MKKGLLLLLMSMVLIGAAGLWWRLRAEGRENAGALAEAQQQRERAEAAVRQAEARRVAAEHERESLEAAIVAEPVTKPAPARTAKSADDTTIAERLQRDPEFQVISLQADRAHVIATYGALFRRFGLSADEVAKFQENVFQKKEREMDLQAIMRTKGLSWDDPVIAKSQESNEAAYVTAQQALLGTERMKQLVDYELTGWLREMMIGWAGGAAVVLQEPFSFEQGEQLVRAMANASERYRRSQHVDTGEPGYWSRVEAEAKKILTPAQFGYFTTMEPPLPAGARFQSAFYNRVQNALEVEKHEAGAKQPGS